MTVTTNASSIWYEVNVARWMASFDLWRARYFTADDQANPALRGDAATPYGDGVPNLLKYYLGLPGRAPAPPGSPPTGSLLPLSDQLYLALSYNRDKLVKDVNCAPQVSPNLANWFSGTGFTRLERTLDLGSIERLTMRDLTPVGSSPQRFMRLWLAR